MDEALLSLCDEIVVMNARGAGTLTEEKLLQALREAANLGFERGWLTAANWAKRDDLLSDVGSPAYLADREAALRYSASNQ